MKKNILFLLVVFLVSCDGPSKISVENRLSKASLKDVRWGDVYLSGNILPGERSGAIEIHSNSYTDIDLPESHIVSFYLDVNGDQIYLETKNSYYLGIEDELVIVISDNTAVSNPLADDLLD